MKTPSNPIKITQVPIADLKPAEYNPRTHTKKQKASLRESLTKFGIVDPILVNIAPKRKNIVIGGHFRLKILKDLGYEKVPVVFVNLPDIEQEKELNLRLNQNQGQWDFDLLKDFDIDLLLDVGFDEVELGNLWSDLLVPEEDRDTRPEIDEEAPIITQPGDLIELGGHRLLCGDATDPSVLKQLMNGQQTSMIYCDPPYNIGLSYDTGIAGKGSFGGKQTKDAKPADEYRNFLETVLQNTLTHSTNDAHVFFWADPRWTGLLQQLYESHGINHKRTCLWIKNTQMATPKVAFHRMYEPCVYGIKGSPYLDPKSTKMLEVLNQEIGTGNRSFEDILDLIDIWLVKRLAPTSYAHPTEKPVTLHEKPLKRCTKPGDIVLDCFGGSGSTLMACEQLGRKAYMTEIEPRFCDVIVARWEAYTKQKAVRHTNTSQLSLLTNPSKS